MIESVTGAVSALRGALAMAKTAIDFRDDKKIAEAMTSINDKIIAVQDACMRLQETNSTLLQDKHTLANEKRELENEIAQLRQQTDKLAKYERVRLPSGAFVFVETESKDSTDGPVYACVNCIDEGKISTMQINFNSTWLSCPIHGSLELTAREPQPRRRPGAFG